MTLRRLVAVTTLLVLAVAVGPAAAAPTCTVGGTEPLCGGRVVAEPMASTTFLQYGLEFVDVLHAIEAINPDVIEVRPLSEWTGNDEHVSYRGLDLWVVRVTDESLPDDDKRHAVASLSVHANESAGREGGVRYLEDVARWTVDEPGRLVYSGDVALPLDQVLRETVLWLGFTNPDGWATGDVADPAGPTFTRGNGNNGGRPHTPVSDGADLNREFPTVGWTKRANTQLSEPEAIGWVEFVSSLPNVTTATDIHGELTSATDSFADMMWPAGQWTPRMQAQELQLAQNMTATIERKFEDYGVVIDDIFAAAGSGRGLGTKPAQYATAYDIVGYDDSGFMGDWFVTQGAVEIDVENFLSHLAPGNVWLGALEEGHVAAVRGILESLWVEAVITDEVRPSLDLGRVAYVDDPATVSSRDDNGFGFEVLPGEDPKHYDVTRLRYFEDLAVDAGTPVDALATGDVTAETLASYDSLVVADVAFPEDVHGRAVSRDGYVAALRSFVEGGGQLLLTDNAVELLVDLGIVEESDLRSGVSDAGHVDFGADRSHPWEADLAGLPAQTYYEVPLGYTSGVNPAQAPHRGVASAAWEAAGGTTVGTSLGFTTLGEAPMGDGKVSLFGAILPSQTEANPHLYGLADYGVTVNGGAVLHSILSYRSPNAPTEPDCRQGACGNGRGRPDDPPGHSDPPGRRPRGDGQATVKAASWSVRAAPLPATGGGAALAAVGLLAATTRRRRDE